MGIIMTDQTNKPDSPDGPTRNKGNIPGNSGRRKEALRVFAIAAENHRRGRMDDALRGYARALSIDPRIPDVYNNMGVALRVQGKLEAAIACYRRSLALRPDNAGVYSNMGNALREIGKLEAAVKSHRRAVELSPKSPEAIYNMGLTLRDLGGNDRALECFEKALDLKDGYVECRWDRALSLLMNGDLERGFEEYEWRWKLDRGAPRNYDEPLWDGSELNGTTILLHHEQGFGDTIQFARYVPMVAARGGRVVVECQPELTTLLRTIDGADQIIARGTPPPAFDTYAPLMSLARIFKTTPKTIPADAPYLKAPETHGVHLPVTAAKKLKVGICWAGKPTHKNDRNRSCPFHHFIDIMGLANIAYFSLQVGSGTRDLQNRACDALAIDMGSRCEDFSDTAAVIDQLDLVVTVDTSVAHLAGALGKPVWILLAFIADWRWTTKGNTSPWYPSATLYRQKAIGDWDDVFATVRKDLQKLAATYRPKPKTTATG